MAVTVFIGPMYMQGNWGLGAAGPAEPWSFAVGLAFDDSGDAIRDVDGNALQILADASLSVADASGGLRGRLEASFAASLVALGYTDTPTFYWSESLV